MNFLVFSDSDDNNNDDNNNNDNDSDYGIDTSISKFFA
jgi:hypothetical protein